MPRKKKPHLPGRVDLNKAQVRNLAAHLRGTTYNVFVSVRTLFSLDVGESVFDQLRDLAGLFKCVECGVWKPVDELTYSPGLPPAEFSDMCKGCRKEADDEMEGIAERQ